MNTEQQEKARFFALYLFQEVYKRADYLGFNNGRPDTLSAHYLTSDSFLDNGYIELRTVDQLTDEELIEVKKILSIVQTGYYEPAPNDISMGKWIISNMEFIHFKIYLWLISIGVCLDEKAFEKGWAVKKGEGE